MEHLRTREEVEQIKTALKTPLDRLKNNLLDICHIDEEMGAAAIITALRAHAPIVLQVLGVR